MADVSMTGPLITNDLMETFFIFLHHILIEDCTVYSLEAIINLDGLARPLCNWLRQGTGETSTWFEPCIKNSLSSLELLSVRHFLS